MMHSLARFAISTHCLILAISLHLPQCQCKQTVFELSSHIQVRTPQDPHTAIGRAPFEGKQHCGRTSMQRASSNSSLAPILAGSPHVDFTTMSFPVEQNRPDQGVRDRSIPPLLNVSLYCNLLHFGKEGRRSGMTHWRAGLGGKRPTHRPFLRISTRWWVIRSGALPSSPDPRPKLLRSHSHAHSMRVQKTEIAAKPGSTGLKAIDYTAWPTTQ